MVIPGLDIYLANIYDYAFRKEFEPFVRVFRGAGREEEEMRRVLDSKWTDKNSKGLAIRTASFGHGQQRLDLCMRESDGKPGVAGVGQDLLVALAILQSYKL